jgi:glycerate dehydrogenase
LQGVILDEGGLGPVGLDLSRLLEPVDEWRRHDATQSDQVAERIAHADVVLTNKVFVGRAAMAPAARLRLIVVTATGTNNVDLVAARERGIAVCNVRNYAGESVAQHTVMLMLALARNLVAYRRSVQSGDWSRSRFFCLHDHSIVDLANRRLAIVGYGQLGRSVAMLAQAFGMRIALAVLPGRVYAEASEFPRLPIDELLGWSDVLSIHCPLTDATRGLIGARELSLMRRHALLINAARGGIVDERALLDAVRNGIIAGAALDVLEVEPPPADHPLLVADLPNLIITPHIAWASRDSRQRLVDQVGEVLAAYRRGEFMNRVA